jgi:hypothetical protein
MLRVAIAQGPLRLSIRARRAPGPMSTSRRMERGTTRSRRMLTKEQIIDAIQRINAAADRDFLQQFDWHALRRYLDHLQITLEPRGLESRWRRPGDTAAVVWRRSAA